MAGEKWASRQTRILLSSLRSPCLSTPAAYKERYDGPAHGNDRLGSDSHGGGYHSLALGPHGMVAIAGSSSGSSGYDYATVVYLELSPPTSFADWAAGFALSGVAAAPAATPDSDGLPNGVEYILGGNPTPDHDDEFLLRIEKLCQEQFPDTVLAREGMIPVA